jgi:phage portal protein BeeE
MFETFYGHLQVAGNAYLEAVTVAGEVRELHVLRPDRMKVVPGKDGWPEAYEYCANGASVRFVQQSGDGVPPILHLRLFSPVDDHYGLSPLEAAAPASTSTTPPRPGTRRCSTTRRGPQAPSSTAAPAARTT